jgi:hypothetical protein
VYSWTRRAVLPVCPKSFRDDVQLWVAALSHPHARFSSACAKVGGLDGDQVIIPYPTPTAYDFTNSSSIVDLISTQHQLPFLLSTLCVASARHVRDTSSVLTHSISLTPQQMSHNV